MKICVTEDSSHTSVDIQSITRILNSALTDIRRQTCRLHVKNLKCDIHICAIHSADLAVDITFKILVTQCMENFSSTDIHCKLHANNLECDIDRYLSSDMVLHSKESRI